MNFLQIFKALSKLKEEIDCDEIQINVDGQSFKIHAYIEVDRQVLKYSQYYADDALTTVYSGIVEGHYIEKTKKYLKGAIEESLK